jgi:type IV pilus assembly protein PilM
MSKAPSSVIGIDLGRHSMKAVQVQRRGSRFILTNFGVRTLNEPVNSPEKIAHQIKSLLKETGGKAKGCSVTLSGSDSIIRIIEQPETPPSILRDALRLNGMSLLNQDCKEFVLDCDAIVSSDKENPEAAAAGAKKVKYVVGGIPRVRVAEIQQAFQTISLPVDVLQLAPISAFNAFAFARPETFANEAFMLLDIGHASSTVIVGVKGELILVRSIEYGGKSLKEMLTANAADPSHNVMQLLESGDELTSDNARLSLAALTREISSSIGFFEGRREETISKIYVSGGPASSKTILSIMTEELHLACESWNPFERCEINLPQHRRDQLPIEMANLTIAAGAAAELLTIK